MGDHLAQALPIKPLVIVKIVPVGITMQRSFEVLAAAGNHVRIAGGLSVTPWPA